MKYMLLIYLDEKGALTEADREKCYVDSAQYAQKLSSKGQFLGASPLHPTSTATSIRMREGKPLVTDGPFAETREQLGGYFLVDAKDLDGAIRLLQRFPPRSGGQSRSDPFWKSPVCRRANSSARDVCSRRGKIDSCRHGVER